MKIYVASSWKNNLYESIINRIRDMGHEVHDWRQDGFGWDSIDSNWRNWTFEEYKRALEHPNAVKGFSADFYGMHSCDACVLLLPCGASAHSEFGWFTGRRRPSVVLCLHMVYIKEPELMYKLCDGVYNNLVSAIKQLEDVHAMQKIEHGTKL